MLANLNGRAYFILGIRCKFVQQYYPVIHPRALLLLIVIAYAGITRAQIRPDSLPSNPDTSKPKIPLRIVSFSPENFDFGNRTIQDSLHYSLDSFQIVHPFLISTGNLGSPAHYLIPRYTPVEAFSVRPDAFSYFGFNRYNRRFYNTNLPYTLLQYFAGQPKEQYVDVLHSRNFGDNLNFSFHFQRIRSEGFYRRQNTSNTSLRTNLWYKSPGKRYSFMTDVFWTGVNVAENGGLEDDSDFEFGTQLDRQQNEVRLDRAGTVQRKRDIWMKHTFALGKVTDTLVLDTSRTYNVITPAWGISIISELYDEKYNFQDDYPTFGFYDVIYRDSSITQDSTYSWRVNNSVRLERFNQYGAKKIRGYIGARHEAGEYFNDTILQHFGNVYAEGIIEWLPDSLASFSLDGNYCASGTNEGNFTVNIRASIPFRFITGTRIFAVINDTRRNPDIIFTNYSGNHFRWQNSFSPMHETWTTTGFSYHGNGVVRALGFAGTQVHLLNYTYFDSTFLPQQYQGDVNFTSGQLWLSTKFSVFHANAKYTYSIFKNDTLLRMPEHVVIGTLYADMKLFRNAMQLQIGVDVTWFSEFTAEAYMPNVAQFYLQNSRTVGNYTYISPWLSFRIKPVRVFVKVDHVNAGLMGRKYFLLDHYPANDMAVKIGISWLFSD